MNTRSFLSTTALALATAITLNACSSDDDKGGGEKYAYCVFMEQQTCLSGSFTSCQNGGNLSQTCPFNVAGLSSGGTGGGGSSSSGAVAGNIESVTIGTQVWMKKNLDVAVEGAKCFGEDGEVFIGLDNNNQPKYKTFTETEIQANCDKYGRIYTWATAMGFPESCNTSICADQIQAKHKGICPNGWHIPSGEEWETLINFVETDNSCTGCAGKYLKATSGWDNSDDGSSGNGLDSYNFTALPGGNWCGDSRYNFSNSGCWWSTYEDKSYEVDYYRMSSRNDNLQSHDDNSKSRSKSVRCIKD